MVHVWFSAVLRACHVLPLCWVLFASICLGRFLHGSAGSRKTMANGAALKIEYGNEQRQRYMKVLLHKVPKPLAKLKT